MKLSEEEQIALFEITTGVSLKQGDFVILHPDKRIRKKVIETFVKPDVQATIKDIKDFVDARINVTEGIVQYVCVERYFTGLEFSLNGMYFPLMCIKSINGKDVDYVEMEARR